MTDDQRAKMMMYHRVSVFCTVNAADFTGTVVPGLVTDWTASAMRCTLQRRSKRWARA